MAKKEFIKLKNIETTSFVKEVAKYFMNFLETDFKKRRIPKRNAIQKTQKGLKVGIDLGKYPKLKKIFLTLLNNGFKKESLQIKKGEYINNVPKNLFNLIEARVKKISKKGFDIVFDEIENLAEEKKLLYVKEYDKFLEETKEETKNIFSRNLVISLLEDLDKPLDNLDIADENSKFQLETDVTDSIFAIFENKYAEVLQHFFQGKKGFDFKNDLQGIIKLTEIKSNLIKFFKSFVIDDAFFDIYQIYRNNKLIDKTEIYLYFYELSLANERFPIFYIPITIIKEEDKFIFQFEKRVFVNTKAINFVVQEFNLKAEKKSTLAGEFDRILYVNGEDDFYSVLKNYIQKIENFFEYNKNIDLQNPELQKEMNLITSFSNKSYLFLFDKSDEALINDYEEILNDNGDILENFSSLLNSFIEENPKAFMEEIEDEWYEKDISQKLIFESPIPLNDEQKQVLIALQKPDCNFMILEGPPGTGKSHTITAIVCKALLEEKSVLVLSDKKEALDVVEDKISSTLNKIRHENDFQNPILRLGRTGSKFYKIVQGQTIQKIKEYYSAYKHKKDEYDELRKNSLRELEKNIKENIDYFAGIDIKDIESYFKNLDKFSTINWINSSEEYDIDLLRIKKGIQKLCKHNDNFKIHRNLLNDANYKLLNEYQNFLNILSESKIDFEEKNKDIDTNVLIKEFDNHTPYDEKIFDSLNSIKTALSELSLLYKDKPVILKLFKPTKELELGVLTWRSEIIDISINLFSESRKFLGEKFDNCNGTFSLFEVQENTSIQNVLILLKQNLQKIVNLKKECENSKKIFIKKFTSDIEILNKCKNFLGQNSLIEQFKISDSHEIEELLQIFEQYIENLKKLKRPLIGYLFKKKEIDKLTANFKQYFYGLNLEYPHKNLIFLESVYGMFKFLYSETNDVEKFRKIYKFLVEKISDKQLNEIKYSEVKKIQRNVSLKSEQINKNLCKIFPNFKLDNIENHVIDLLYVSDLFNFIYEKIPNKYKETEEKDTSVYSIFRILIDLLNNDNDEYLSDYQKIEKLQKKIVTEKELISHSKLSLVDIDDLEYEIQQVGWNIEVFKQINNINRVIYKLSDIIPNDIKTYSDEKCGIFFGNDIRNSLSKFIKTIEKLRMLKDDIDFILNIKEKHPDFAEKINLSILTKNINESSSILSDYTDEKIKEYSKHKILQSKIEKQFNSQPEDRFSNSINEIEDLTTARMTYFLDKRIIDYTQDCAGEVNTLKNIVRRKQKFPKDLFLNLKKAFPCILAGIRDYAEFIPLEKNLFDLIIIDEASQVSIAQALPALVRGKQIIVLGDDKQFSNVKANNASKVTNQELRKRVQDAFLEERLNGVDKNGWLTKVKENFDIKNSILKFSRFIRNYECQLRKHFRCYPEIISYSDKYFYDNTLQCMKIRGKQIEDVIKIDFIDHDGKFDENKNTNELEVNYIIKKLQEFKEKEIKQSFGIITPHREQVTLFFDKINELPERDWLFGKCKLKIMTFDTCQGEERDYIFYSMVATKEKDRLNCIFLKDFSSISDEIDGTLRSQRMNVGFSRAKECIHFVLSKPIEEFQGEIKNAMLHYQNELKIGKKRIVKKLDSEMEYRIDEIFHNTKFYKENKEKIEFIPQFELGKYLKQLNRNYNHPNYRVDFLLIFGGQKIVLEYDGFKEHFADKEDVNESNYKYYMKDDDIYRQKVLEGYGYKFLRINRFNIGDAPIETLDNRLQNLVKKNFKIK